MRAFWAVVGGLCLASAAMVSAQRAAEGMASGYYVTEKGTRIEVRYVRAGFVDEASSGHPERGEYHVLLTDRPVGPEALDEFGPGSARDLAERGDLLGVRIEFDPRERDDITFVELERSSDEYGPNSRTFSGIPNLWRRIDARPAHVGGELRFDPAADNSEMLPEAMLSFDAPVDYDPVVSMLTGTAARDSAPARAAVTAHEAILAGDLATARRMSTPALAARMTATTLNDGERQFMRNMVEALRNPARVIVRQRSATVVMGGEGLSLSVEMALQDGQWKMAD